MSKPVSNRKPAGLLMPWMTGEYAAVQDIRHHFPIPFLLLCRLAGTNPAQLLKDFADNLGAAAWKRKGREIPRAHLAEYFIAHGYGSDYFSPKEVSEIFADLDAMGRLYPTGDPELAELYGQWRDRHYVSWFNRWYTRNDRKKTLGELMS